jgi:hypothetical protein
MGQAAFELEAMERAAASGIASQWGQAPLEACALLASASQWGQAPLEACALLASASAYQTQDDGAQPKGV